MIAQAIGQAVRELRLGKRMSQEALANVTGIDRSHMGKLERGEHMPTLGAVWKIAFALGISAAKLIAETEKRFPEN